MCSYTYDLHVHTSNVSMCGHVRAQDVVRMYCDTDYQGIVVTDHYFDGFFREYSHLAWKEQVYKYIEGYLKAKTEGVRLGLDVFLGAEVRFTDSLNDYLVYGITPQLLTDYPRLFDLNLFEFKQLCEDVGALVYQAHPFRSYLHRADPQLLDGVEVFNGNPRHNSYNDKAYNFAKAHRLSMISGSDFHQDQDLGSGGVIFSQRVQNSKHLVKLLANNEIVELKGIRNEVDEC